MYQPSISMKDGKITFSLFSRSIIELTEPPETPEMFYPSNVHRSTPKAPVPSLEQWILFLQTCKVT
jgi:hypothetical protein